MKRLTLRRLGHGPGRWFWLANLLLLALYAWTLTERTSFSVRLSGDRCTGVLMGRTSAVSCPGLEGGKLGLYLGEESVMERVEREQGIDTGLLEWLAPGPAWHRLRLSPDGDEVDRTWRAAGLAGWPTVRGEWRLVGDELRASSSEAVLAYEEPLPQAMTVSVQLRRPGDPAGIVLTGSDAEEGWVFVLDGKSRWGMWFRWENGRLAEALKGVPFDRALMAQSQSLLRQILRGHQVALMLLVVIWLLAWFYRRLGRHFIHSAGRLRQPGERTVAIGLILATFWATSLITVYVLERVPHVQDSITTLFQAQTLSGGRLWADAPPLPEFFEQEFLLVKDGRWFGKYTPGYPLLLAIGVLLEAPWLVNPLLATLTVALLYKLGSALYGRSLGLGAAGLGLASPFFLFLSGSMMTHPAELLWLTLFLLAWFWALRRAAGNRWALVAGIALGMAFLTRQASAVAVGLPYTGVTIISMVCGRYAQPIRKIAARLTLLSLAFVPFVGLLLAYQNTLTGDPLRDPRVLYWSFDRLGFGEDVGADENAITLVEVDDIVAITWFHDPTQPPRGHTVARGLYNTERNWRALEHNLFGWIPLFTLAFCWLVFVLRRPALVDLFLLSVIGGVAGLYVAYWSTGIMYGPRYYYAALPAFLLLTARGMQTAGAAAGHWSGSPAVKRSVHLAAGTIVVLFIAGYLILGLPDNLRRYRGFNFIEGRPAMAAELVEGEKAIIFVSTTEQSNWWEYGQYFSRNTPWLDGLVIFARDLGPEQNGRLIALYPDRQPYLLQNGQLQPIK